VISWGVESQAHLPLRREVNRHTINPVCLATKDQEDVRLPVIVPNNRALSVNPRAPGCELDASISHSSGLALTSQKFSVAHVENHVVPLVEPERKKNVVAPLHKLAEDRCFASEPHVHWVGALGRRGQRCSALEHVFDPTEALGRIRGCLCAAIRANRPPSIAGRVPAWPLGPPGLQACNDRATGSRIRCTR